jgi:outer membrane protein TolC
MVWKKAFVVSVLFWTGFIGGTITAWAEVSGTTLQLDLPACIEQALKANPQMEEARLGVLQSELLLKSSRLSRTPKIELFNRFGIVEDAEGDAITGDTIDGSFGFFNKLDLKITVPLYTFGRLSRNIHAAKENVNRQMASQLKTTSDLILRVHQLYYGLVLARQLLRSTRDIQKNFSLAHEIAEERLEKGETSVTETDVLKLRLGLAGIAKGVRKLQRQVRVTKEALRQTMGLGDQIDFTLVDKKLKPVAFELRSLEHYLQQAEADNPQIKQLKAALAAADARYLAEKSKYYPMLLAVGGLRYAEAPGREDQHNPFLKDDFNFFNGGAALAIKWDLNFLQTDTNLQRKKVQYLRMKSRLRQVLAGIAFQVKEKYHLLMEKKDNLESSFEARKAGRAILFLNLTNFKFGLGTGEDVFDALSVHARTAGNYFKAIFDYNLSVAELHSFIGDQGKTQE